MIGDEAFYGCGLTEVTLGDGVTLIGLDTFLGCSINILYSYATTPPELSFEYYSYSFKDGVELGATLYVPAGCGEAYKSSVWGNYFDNIIEME